MKKLQPVTLRKRTRFYLRKYSDCDDLHGPTVVLKEGTQVIVQKVCKQFRHTLVLLGYEDRSGKVWWSWCHTLNEE